MRTEPVEVFEVRGQRLGWAELDALARAVAAALPEDYREFMAKGDGGVFLDPNRYGSSFRGGLNELFAFRDHSPSFWSFAVALGVYRHRVPSGFLPIGDDLAGNLIVLGVGSPHYGEVFFWDHENEVGDGQEPTMENMEFIAGSFGEFLDAIRIAE